jgi:outer membrane protein assembly factor BamB
MHEAKKTVTQLTIALAIMLGSLPLLAETNWPQWRGPSGNGHSSVANVPVQWSADSLLWKTKLPGQGQSTPIYWENKLFVTSSLDDGTKRALICIDLKSGKILWQKICWEGTAEKTHSMNNRASSTCVTDGKRIISFFGHGGIHCHDFDGNVIWSRELGDFGGPWGTASSPIIAGKLVIQNCDADDVAYLLGLELETGKTVWKTKRETVRGWSTPIIVKTDSHSEIVLNGNSSINAYNLEDGKPLWHVTGTTGRGTPTVTPARDFLVAVSGRSGDMIAMRPGGKGDVTKSHVVWRSQRRGGRDLPSPIVVGDYLVVTRLRPGLASCYDVATGKELWTKRMDGGFSSSPIAVNGLIYATDESGTTSVIRPGKTFELLATNRVNGEDSSEIFRASPTPVKGRLLLRSDTMLYCVGKP